ncbi:MAG: DNA-directed RNA polymerase subunit beta', partial [Bacteroidetes bacterium]
GIEIKEDIAKRIDETSIEQIELRSVLTCEAKQGVCSKCYGRNLASGKMVQIGEAVGVIAAQSIGEPGTQLTLRTFHVGGAASNIATDASIRSKFAGKVEFEEMRFVPTLINDEQLDVVMARTAEVKVLNSLKQILITYHIPYGAFLRIKDGQMIEKGQELCFWDPYNAVILSQYEGVVEFDAIEEGVTFREEYDEQTGHREKVIIDTRDKTKNPAIMVHGLNGEKMSSNVPVDSHLAVEHGDRVKAGQVLVKIPRKTGKTRDITGGLPRVTELFEARNPSNPAIISEIDGYVSYGVIKRGNREIFVQSKDGVLKKYMVPLSKHILVQENDYVRAGYPLSDGATTPSDILAIKGPTAVQEYLVNEIQEVYRLQGVKINDKHIEVIVRQMMQKVIIIDPGDTTFLPGQVVDRFTVMDKNDAILDRKVVTESGSSPKMQPGMIVTARELRDENSSLKRRDLKVVKVRDAQAAVSKPTLQGITQASLGTKSVFSAASFQETTKVLSEAAIRGKIDYLNGLKENVIVGHLIPAGTGMRQYNEIKVFSKEEQEALKESKEAFTKSSKKQQMYQD